MKMDSYLAGSNTGNSSDGIGGGVVTAAQTVVVVVAVVVLGL